MGGNMHDVEVFLFSHLNYAHSSLVLYKKIERAEYLSEIPDTITHGELLSAVGYFKIL